MRTFLATTATVLVAALTSAGSALADCASGTYDEPLPPITSITPAPNTAIEQSYVYPVRFTVVSPLHFVGFYTRVSSRPQLGQTGILSDLVGLDDTILTESATDPDDYFGESSFTASSLTTWMDVPGTYYWQLFGSWADDSFHCHAFAGPINTITITPSTPSAPAAPPQPPSITPPTSTTSPSTTSPPPTRSSPVATSRPPVTLAQALGYASRAVSARAGLRPHVRLSCTATGRRAVHCALRWSAGGASYLATGHFTWVGHP